MTDNKVSILAYSVVSMQQLKIGMVLYYNGYHGYDNQRNAIEACGVSRGDMFILNGFRVDSNYTEIDVTHQSGKTFHGKNSVMFSTHKDLDGQEFVDAPCLYSNS